MVDANRRMQKLEKCLRSAQLRLKRKKKASDDVKNKLNYEIKKNELLTEKLDLYREYKKLFIDVLQRGGYYENGAFNLGNAAQQDDKYFTHIKDENDSEFLLALNNS